MIHIHNTHLQSHAIGKVQPCKYCSDDILVVWISHTWRNAAGIEIHTVPDSHQNRPGPPAQGLAMKRCDEIRTSKDTLEITPHTHDIANAIEQEIENRLDELEWGGCF